MHCYGTQRIEVLEYRGIVPEDVAHRDDFRVVAPSPTVVTLQGEWPVTPYTTMIYKRSKPLNLNADAVICAGKKIAQPILIEGLKRLEYRGYDSAAGFSGSTGCQSYVWGRNCQFSVVEIGWAVVANDDYSCTAGAGKQYTHNKGQ
jgi:hypothetical protein